MKRIFTILVCLMLMGALTLTAFADGNELRLRSSELKAGELVYITVELLQSAEGNGMGISYKYDEEYLKPVPASCSWTKSSLMQNFNETGTAGVWAAEKAEDLKGGVCVLAFRLVKGLNFKETFVECTLRVKNGSQEVGTYTNSIKLTSEECAHTYGNWEDLAALGHSRACTKCGDKVTESHRWNEGVATEMPSGETHKLYTCQICGGTKSIATGEAPEVTQPTVSADDKNTKPTGPQTLNPEPNDDKKEPDRYYPEGTEKDPTGETEHSHDHNDTITIGKTDPVTDDAQDSHEGHDHGAVTVPGKKDPTTVIVLSVLAVVIVAAVIIFLKKKK